MLIEKNDYNLIINNSKINRKLKLIEENLKT